MAKKRKAAVSPDRSLNDALIQLRVPADLKRAFDEAARSEGRSLSSWLRRLGEREISVPQKLRG